jgi:hypothetical protein
MRSLNRSAELLAVAALLCCRCVDEGLGVPAEPVPECIQYEQAVASCYRRKLPIATHPSLIPHTREVRLPRFRGHLVYAASAPLRKAASVSFGVL